MPQRSGEHYCWGDGCEGWRLFDDGQLNVTQERMPPGTSEARHAHRLAGQYFYVLAGGLNIELPDRVVALKPREGVYVSPTVAHRVANTGAVDAEFILVSRPSSRGDKIMLEGS